MKKEIYKMIEELKKKNKCSKVLIVCHPKREQELNETFASSSDCKVVCIDGLYNSQYNKHEDSKIVIMPDYNYKQIKIKF